MEKVTNKETEKKENIAGEAKDQKEQQEINPARLSAVKILSRYDRSDSYIDKLLAHELKHKNFNPQDKALLTEIINGVIRWRSKLDWVLNGFYFGDYQKCLNIIKNSMRVGLYQMMMLDRIPPYAAINDAVEIVKNIQSEKTAGVVNGVLRNILRNINKIRYPDTAQDEVYHYAIIHSHPKWMVKRWMTDIGLDNTIKMMEFNNKRPYVPLRINTELSSPEEIRELFRKHNVKFEETNYLQNSIKLESPNFDISETEIFKKGKVTVQDTSASLAAKLACPKEDNFVLDLCAAPGGKSFYLAEQMHNTGRVVAVDKYFSKLKFIEEGAKRLRLDKIETLEADAENIEFEEKPDIIFADVPCSGIGTLSKKPDIKWKRDLGDVREMAGHQKKILANAVKLSKPGTVIVYSTCTTEPEENQDNVKWFLENYPEFELDPAEKYLPKDLCKDGMMVVTPYEHNLDGAFAVRLVRKS